MSKKSAPRSGGRPLRLHGRIARDLGIAIVSGRYKPGSVLGGEIESSLELKVSRSAYREAVRILAAKGLVESRPKVGTKISQKEYWHLLDPDVLSWIFAGNPDTGLLKGLFELRQIVEPAATALAASRRTDSQLRRMKTALERMTLHTLQTEAGQQADRDFHAALLHATGNSFVASLTRGIVAAVETTTIYKLRALPVLRDPVPEHAKVFQAVAAGNAADAEAAMRELIRLAYLDTPAAR
jgi:DNA-binding FadR family transcriptional regulator